MEAGEGKTVNGNYSKTALYSEDSLLNGRGDGYIYRYTRMTVTTTVQYVCDTFLKTMMMMTHSSSTVCL